MGVADLVDSEVAAMLTAGFEAELRSIWAAMERELDAYVTAHVDPADRTEADVALITGHALARVDAANARFSVALESACVESERAFFDRAPLQ
jgi:hypothetical protein